MNWQMKTGFKESIIWNKLYDFQKDAVLGIINKLERHNGCILRIVFGLEKLSLLLVLFLGSIVKVQDIQEKLPSEVLSGKTTLRIIKSRMKNLKN